MDAKFLKAKDSRHLRCGSEAFGALPPTGYRPYFTPPVERFLAALEDVRREFLDLGGIDGARSLQPGAAVLLMKDADPFGIAKDRDIGVVRCEDKLALALVGTQLTHDVIGDKRVVEIVLGLVDY